MLRCHILRCHGRWEALELSFTFVYTAEMFVKIALIGGRRCDGHGQRTTLRVRWECDREERQTGQGREEGHRALFHCASCCRF